MKKIQASSNIHDCHDKGDWPISPITEANVPECIGLTRREYYAAQFMAHAFPVVLSHTNMRDNEETEIVLSSLANMAIQAADQLLLELEKQRE